MKSTTYNTIFIRILSLIFILSKYIHSNNPSILNDNKDINNLKVQLNISSPQLSNVFHETNNSFIIAIELLEPNINLPELTFICITMRSIEKCTQVSTFDIEMISSGTFSLQISLKSYLNIEKYINNEYIILSSINTVIDIANDNFLQTLIHGINKEYELLKSYLSILKYEHLILYQYKSYNNQNEMIPWKVLASSSITNITTANQFIQQHHLHSQSFPMVYRDISNIVGINNNNNDNIYHNAIVFYISNVDNILDSNRFKDWLCDSDIFLKHGFTMTIITTTTSTAITPRSKDSNNNNDDNMFISQYCGVDIIRFEALSISKTIHLIEYFDEILTSLYSNNNLDRRILNSLIMFLSNNTDVLLLINTFGDPQTTLLLKCVNYLKERNRSTTIKTTTTTTTNIIDDDDDIDDDVDVIILKDDNVVPLVLMDLPNKDIPYEWYTMIDAFIAPSRAVAFDHSITNHG